MSNGNKGENPTKRWLFRLTAILLVPAFFFVACEVLLRVFGFGYRADFFVPRSLNNRKVFTDNAHYTRRFFGPDLQRSPWPVVLSAEKPAESYRIFVLGGSAAMGDPVPEFGFPRLLQLLLAHAYPEQRFEVINVAMTSINSHVVRQIAGECVHRDPDFFVLYMGNNEVIGPYGPGTIFQSFSPSLAYIRASIWLKGTRIGQALTGLSQWMTHRSGTPREWAGMEMFLKRRIHADEAILQHVYEHFEANLNDIISLGRQHGARTLLCNIPVNQRHCPPFASLHDPALPKADRAVWEQHYRKGVSLEEEGQFELALAQYRQAIAMDDTFAAVHMRMARCLDEMGRLAAANEAYARASELDALRFRADASVNAHIKRVADAYVSDNVQFVDLVDVLRSAHPQRLLDETHFYDHVHLNFAGNYLVALRLLFELSRMLPPSVHTGSLDDLPILSEAACRTAAPYTAWDQFDILEQMYARFQVPPFTHQIYHDELLERYRSRLYAVKQQSGQALLARSAHSYREQIRHRTDDWILYRRLAALLAEAGNPEEALTHYRRTLEFIPHHARTRLDFAEVLAQVGRYGTAWTVLQTLRLPNLDHPAQAFSRLGYRLAESGRVKDALPLFREAVKRRPEYVEALNNLGIALVTQDRLEEALDAYRRAIRLDPNNIETLNNMGAALAQAGERDPAYERFKEALSLDPDNADAHFNLGVALAEDERDEEAQQHFEAAIQARPSATDARYNLALLHIRHERLEEAEAHLQASIDHDPMFSEAHRTLADLYDQQQRYDDALTHYRMATILTPSHTAAHVRSARLLVRENNLAEAVAHFRAALRMDPFRPAVANDYAWILATAPDPKLRDPERAVHWADKACALTDFTEPVFLDTLATAYAASGEFERAIESGRKAASLADAHNRQRLKIEIRERLALFQAGKPYRSSIPD